jgi:hypothetical protein
VGRPSLELLDDALAVSLLVLVGARILVSHAEAHCPVEEDGDLAGGSCQGFGLANTRGQSPIERAERGFGATDRGGDQSQARGDSVVALAGMRREHLASANLAARRQSQPGRKVLLGRPPTEVGAALCDELQGHAGADAVDLGQIDPGELVQQPLMATSNSSTCGHSNSPRQDGRIMRR